MVITTGINAPTPQRDDEASWPLVVAHEASDGEQMLTFADTHTEILGALIAGYADIADTPTGHDQAVISRYEHAVAVATATQGALCAQAGDAGRFDPAGESEEVLTALFTERDRPFVGIDRPAGGRSYDWQHDVPLVLLDTDYEPYTGRRTPTGRIVWLRPALESSYLDSLAEIGAVRQLVKVG